MTKEKLLQIIDHSAVSDGLKLALRVFVTEHDEVTAEVVHQIRKRIRHEMDARREEIMHIQIQNAANKFNKKMDEVEKDILSLETDIHTQADDIDLKLVQAKMTS